MPSKYTRRHYVQLAALIADLRLDALDFGDLFMLETVDLFRSRLAEVFSRDNPSFSLERFVSACETSRTQTRQAKKKVTCILSRSAVSTSGVTAVSRIGRRTRSA